MTPTIGRIDITPMSQAEAEEIAGWRYVPPYDFYDHDADQRDLAELLDPAGRGDRYYSAHSAARELIGFFELRNAGDVVVVGVGLRPDLTGHRLGQSFLEAGLVFARGRFAPRRFKLSVADFNARAIKVYERAGFITTRSFMHETNGGIFSFVEMERPA